LLGLAYSPIVAQEAEWPQWRGPRRDGVAGDVGLPRDWLDAELKVCWRVPLGEGYATPLVVGDRVFTFGREGTSEVVQAHERATGRVRWRVAYPAKYEATDAKGVYGDGPRSTPIVHGGRVFTFGINEVLHAIDAPNGRILWRIDFRRRFGTEPPGYGAASSPLIFGRLLLVPAGDRVVAVDWRSGSVVWRAKADSFYASLITAELAGRPQIVAFTRYRLLGLDPHTGRRLWTHRYPSPYGTNIATPIVWNDRVVISSYHQGTRCLRVVERGGRVVIEPVWHTREFKAYLTSPVARGDHLFGLEEGGRLFCVNLHDGRTEWSAGTFSDFGTLALAGDHLLILSGYGELTAVEASSHGYRELGQRELAKSATWAPLVVAKGCLFVRDKKELTCFELPAGR
jgi:outer membrane protein assembly factor BamB